MNVFPYFGCFAVLFPGALQATTLEAHDVRVFSEKIDALAPLEVDVVDDATFLRRSYLTIVGRIPTGQEALDFFNDNAEAKRENLIETLVSSPGHESHMFNFWADQLRLNTTLRLHGLGWHLFIQDFVSQDMSYDVFVREMLTASGHTTENPAVGYYLRDRFMLLDNVSNTARVFLGQQIGCAQCHDHPFDTTTQLEYYQLAAFSGGIVYRHERSLELSRKVAQSDVDSSLDRKAQRQQVRQGIQAMRPVFQDFQPNALYFQEKKGLKLPTDYAYDDAEPGSEVQPATLYGKNPKETGVEAFAKWVTAEDNKTFTKVIVNRLWAEVYGQGIHTPLDDWSDPPVGADAEMIRLLEDTFQSLDYKVRDFLRVLYHTEAFQNAQSVSLKRLSGEQIMDSLLTLNSGNRDSADSGVLRSEWEKQRQISENLLGSSVKELKEWRTMMEKNASAISDTRVNIRTAFRKAKLLNGEGRKKEAAEQRKIARANQAIYRELTEGLSMQANLNANRKRIEREFRISVQPVPQSPQSISRIFGSMDGMTPDSGRERGSIPQVLALLNNPQIRNSVSTKSHHGRFVSGGSTDEEQIERTFLSIMSKRPTSGETAACLPLFQEKNGGELLARTLISTNSFLFIK